MATQKHSSRQLFSAGFIVGLVWLLGGFNFNSTSTAMIRKSPTFEPSQSQHAALPEDVNLYIERVLQIKLEIVGDRTQHSSIEPQKPMYLEGIIKNPGLQSLASLTIGWEVEFLDKSGDGRIQRGEQLYSNINAGKSLNVQTPILKLSSNGATNARYRGTVFVKDASFLR